MNEVLIATTLGDADIDGYGLKRQPLDPLTGSTRLDARGYPLVLMSTTTYNLYQSLLDEHELRMIARARIPTDRNIVLAIPANHIFVTRNTEMEEEIDEDID